MLAERPQRARHQLQHPFGLRAAARVRGGAARCARRRARRRNPAALAAERGALPEPRGEGLAAIDPRDPAARRRPHAVEAWSLRVDGAPELLFERTHAYNRLVFSPMSVVAHDDVHLFESIQRGLAADGNEWVSLHRGFEPRRARSSGTRDTNGTNELLMRNQFRAWATFHGSRRMTSAVSARAIDVALERELADLVATRRACSTPAATTNGSRCSPTTAATGCRCWAPRRPTRFRQLARLRGQAAAHAADRAAEESARAFAASAAAAASTCCSDSIVEAADDPAQRAHASCGRRSSTSRRAASTS